jgi:ABC-type sugar transport system ATPase subunit
MASTTGTTGQSNARPAGPATALRLKGITKAFGGVEVLHQVDLEVKTGEIRGIIGENGAGKSTLMKIAGGLMRPSAGVVEVNEDVLRHGLHEARKLGVILVHQELTMVPGLSVAENSLLGDLPTTGGLVRHGALRRKAQLALKDIAPHVDLDTPVERLRFADRQLVEIARALREKPQILILDEPTSSLSPVDAKRLFGLLRRLRSDRGTTILYISHRLPEVMALCDCVSVLRDGRLVAEYEVSNINEETLAYSMVGREHDLLHRRSGRGATNSGQIALSVENLYGPGVAGVSLAIRSGEICGLGGLVGSGRTELARLLVGLVRPKSGRIQYLGRGVRFRSVRAAARAGIAYVPEDRTLEGLALDLTTGDNLLIASLLYGDVAESGGRIRRGVAKSLVSKLMGDAGVRPPEAGKIVRYLSGGNQQKIVIGRWLPVQPRLFVLDEPTRGVDVGAKSELHARISQLAGAGAAILLISSEISELLSLSDRIVVMREGRVSGEVAAESWTEEEVITLASTARPTAEAVNVASRG